MAVLRYRWLITLAGIKNKSCSEVLNRQQERDLVLGYTQAGPHRAELRIKVDKQPAAEILSRGQQNRGRSAEDCTGCAVSSRNGRRTIYLVDDLASELDEKHRFALCKLLEDLKCQVFITSIDKEQLINCWHPQQSKVFHVEQAIYTKNCPFSLFRRSFLPLF